MYITLIRDTVNFKKGATLPHSWKEIPDYAREATPEEIAELNEVPFKDCVYVGYDKVSKIDCGEMT